MRLRGVNSTVNMPTPLDYIRGGRIARKAPKLRLHDTQLHLRLGLIIVGRWFESSRAHGRNPH